MKQKRAAHSHNGTWQDVSLLDSDGYFRGQAIFETEKEALKYLEIYNDRLQKRMLNNPCSKMNIQLKVFKEGERSEINNYLF